MSRGVPKQMRVASARGLIVAVALAMSGLPLKAEVDPEEFPDEPPLCDFVNAEVKESPEEKEPTVREVAESALKAEGLKLDVDSLHQYIKQFAYEAGIEAQVKNLIEELGGGSFARRKEAHQKLKAMFLRARSILEREKEHSDPEVRSRIRALLDGFEYETFENTLSHAVLLLRESGEKRPPDLLNSMLLMLPAVREWTRSYLLEQASELATPADREVVMNLLKHPKNEIKEAAYLLLPRVLEIEERKEDRQELEQHVAPLLSAEEPRWKMIAGTTLGNARDIGGLRVLLQVIEEVWKKENNIEFVEEAEGALFALTDEAIVGDNFGERLHHWKMWLAKAEADPSIVTWHSCFQFANTGFLLRSRWRVVHDPTSDLKPNIWIFLKNGRLRIAEGSDATSDNDFWELKGSTLIVRQNDYVTYTGRFVSNSYIKGDALNIKKRRWTWDCRRQGGSRVKPGTEKP